MWSSGPPFGSRLRRVLRFLFDYVSSTLRQYARYFEHISGRVAGILTSGILVVGVVTETRRLIGGTLLTSVVLGTYHRPVRQQLIVMFLDIAHSTGLAEAMGELRVHDLITRFFFDIDGPISDYGGAVHAYVGDEVIVSWPVTADPARNARCVLCFFAIERKMARLAADYRREFEVVPAFRAGVHAGPVIVSECGDTKRQLAYFGDTMNVAARLCEHCKAVDQRLVVSGDLLRLLTIPGDLVGEGKRIAVRGRREQVAAHVIKPTWTHSRSRRTSRNVPAERGDPKLSVEGLLKVELTLSKLALEHPHSGVCRVQPTAAL